MRPESTSSPDRINELVGLLQQKFQKSGQDMASYLEGLLYADYLSYWDYIHLDTLLSLQAPKTNFPDEMVFIMYHQITELYFKLTLHELSQLTSNPQATSKEATKHLSRCVYYFKNLVDSFDTMHKGMDSDQFLKFRMSLLPASGFQSGQFRTIEIVSTTLDQLVAIEGKDPSSLTMEEQFEFLYWRSGATELATGQKTLTLIQFEEKYNPSFLKTALKHKETNVRRLVQKLIAIGDLTDDLKSILRDFDTLVNVQWKLMHYKSAVRYLDRSPDVIAATGGTNWQKYLPPRFQKRVFFPEVWSSEDIENWGKSWVMETLGSR